MAKQTAILFFAFLATPSALAHTRLECPPPRSGKTGEKKGPCDAPDDLSLPAYPLIPNALNTITWLESIGHPAAPARFALSLEGVDEGFEECLLLDHIPHDDMSRPKYRDQTSYHRSSITLWIPDIYCERCHLQLITVMSDGIHGVPDDTYCVYKGAQEAGLADPNLPDCPAVYHSCAPVSINGTIPRNQIETCHTPMLEEVLDWPFMAVGNNQKYSTYYAKGNPGLYNQTDARLLEGGMPLQGCTSYSFCDPETYLEPAVEVPAKARYTAMAGTCAAMVGMAVEPFELGKLPDQMVFEVEMMNPADYMATKNASSMCEGYGNCTELLAISKSYVEGAVKDGPEIEDGAGEDSDEGSSGTRVSYKLTTGGLAFLLIFLGI